MPGVAHELLQDIEFERGDFDGLAVQGHVAATGVEHHAIDFQPAAVHFGFGAAEDSFHARRKLAWIERLGKIIVGSQFQADDAVDILPTGGQHQHWNPALSAKPLQNLEAVQARQHHIQNNKVIAALLGVFQTRLAVMGTLDREAFPLQKLFQKAAQFDVVVDD